MIDSIKIVALALFLSLLPAGNVRADIKFGTLSIIHPYELETQLKPFVNFLSDQLQEDVQLQIGRNYQETLEKLEEGVLDIGLIGPAPYVKIMEDVELIATMETRGKPFFRSVIVVREDSDIHYLSDLKGRRFAFGSPESTLSFYVPAYILMNNNILSSLSEYGFLNKHDRVAKNVVIGKYDAGAMKESVYREYGQYLRAIYTSKEYFDFVVVARKGLGKEKKTLLQNALLELDDETILHSLKPGATGFIVGDVKNYDEIRAITDDIDRVFEFHDGQPN